MYRSLKHLFVFVIDLICTIHTKSILRNASNHKNEFSEGLVNLCPTLSYAASVHVDCDIWYWATTFYPVSQSYAQ